MKEGFSRRDFLKGSVSAAMAMGAESVEARTLSEEDVALAEALRAPVRDILGDAAELFAHIEIGEIREYVRVIRNAPSGKLMDETTSPGRNLMNLFLTNPVDGHPNRVRTNAEAVIRDMQHFLRREASYIEQKGLKKEVEKMEEKLRGARAKITDILSDKKRR